MKKVILIILLIAFKLNAQTPLLHTYNLNFEIGEPGKMPPGWVIPTFASKWGYEGTLTAENPHMGKYCFELKRTLEFKDSIYGSLMQSIDAKPYRGKTVKLRAAVRVELSGPHSSGHLWIREHLNEKMTGLFEDMEMNPIILSDWRYYEISGKIDEYAEKLNFGLMLKGNGKAWIDDISFEIIDSSKTANEPPKALSDLGLKNLQFFSKIYGMARYFYAGTEAQSTNWDDLAMLGAEYCENASDSKDLTTRMTKLFATVAPGIKFSTNPDDPLLKQDIYQNALNKIALCRFNQGVPVGIKNQYFGSKSINVYNPVREKEGSVIQMVNCTEYRGKTLQISLFARADVYVPSSMGQIWIRLDKSNEQQILAITSQDEPIVDNKWKNYKIKFDVPENASLLRIGLVLLGDGIVVFDDVKLEDITKPKSPKNIELLDQDFEEGQSELNRGWKLAPASQSAGYFAEIIKDNPHSGKKALKISTDPKTKIILPLDNTGEIVSQSLAKENIYAYFPKTVKVDSNSTLPHPELLITPYKSSKPDGFIINGNDRTSRLAITMILWNIFSRFSVLNDDQKKWDEIFDKSMSEAALDKDESELLKTLIKMSANLNDCQSRVWLGDHQDINGLPFVLKEIDDKIVATVVSPNTNSIKQGDIITAINGISILEYIKKKEEFISGSSLGWKQVRALAEIRAGAANTEEKISFLNKDGQENTETFKRNVYLEELAEHRPDKYFRIDNNIVYMDLTRTNDKEFKGLVDSLKKFQNIIFDVRGQINITEFALGYFIKESAKSLNWKIPIFTVPDTKSSFLYFTNEIKQRYVLSDKKVIFLCDERTIGYSECFLQIARKIGVGKIVGTSTAGTAGEIILSRIPGNYNFTMTSIYVDLDDGTMLTGKSIKPDILAKPTLKSIRENIDITMEKALELIYKK